MLVEKPIYERAIKEAAEEAKLIKVDLASKERESYRSRCFKGSI